LAYDLIHTYTAFLYYRFSDAVCQHKKMFVYEAADMKSEEIVAKVSATMAKDTKLAAQIAAPQIAAPRLDEPVAGSSKDSEADLLETAIK
jgi:hypothetical protein